MTSRESIAQTFTKTHAEQAYTLLGIRHHHNPAWIKALIRGWENLERRRWQWSRSVLLIQSTTDPGKRYVVTAQGCQCHAAGLGNVCDHLTAWWLCHEAERIRRRAGRRIRQEFDPAVEELF